MGDIPIPEDNNADTFMGKPSQNYGQKDRNFVINKDWKRSTQGEFDESLATIADVHQLQQMQEDFCSLSGVTVHEVDTSGNVTYSNTCGRLRVALGGVNNSDGVRFTPATYWTLDGSKRWEMEFWLTDLGDAADDYAVRVGAVAGVTDATVARFRNGSVDIQTSASWSFSTKYTAVATYATGTNYRLKARFGDGVGHWYLDNKEICAVSQTNYNEGTILGWFIDINANSDSTSSGNIDIAKVVVRTAEYSESATGSGSPFGGYDVENLIGQMESATNKLDHEAGLSGWQGGTTGEHEHLTDAEHTELTEWLDDVTLSDGGAIKTAGDIETEKDDAGVIIDATNNTDAYFVLYSDGVLGWHIYNDHSDTNALKFRNGAGDKMELDGSGNLQIDGELDATNSILIEEIGTATYDDLQDYINNRDSSCYIDGALITENSALDGTIDISAAKGYIKTSDSAIGVVKAFDLDAASAMSLTGDGKNTICIDYNNGTPQFVSRQTEPDHHLIFTIGRVYREATTNHLHIWQGGHQFSDFQWKVHKSIKSTHGTARGNGLVTTESVTEALCIAKTAGVCYRGVNEFSVSAFDSGLSYAITAVTTGAAGSGSFGIADDHTDDFTHGKHIYVDSSTGNDGTYHVQTASHAGGTTTIAVEEAVTDATVDGHIHYQTFNSYYYDGDLGGGADWVAVNGVVHIDNTNYNAVATGLSALTANRYGVHWVYQDLDEDVFVIYGQGDYTLNQAEEANPPSTVPDIIDKMCFLVAKVWVKKSAAAWTDVVYPWATVFGTTGATVHNDLGGIQGGAANDYYHVTSAQATGLVGWDGLLNAAGTEMIANLVINETTATITLKHDAGTAAHLVYEETGVGNMWDVWYDADTNQFKIYNDVANENALKFVDATSDATFAGDVTVPNLITAGNVDGIDVSAHDIATTGVHGAGANTLLHTGDVDDTPVNGATTAPISSNWAYDHSWYSWCWRGRKKVTIDNTKVGGDLTNFPVLLTEANFNTAFFSKCLATGADIVVTSSDGVTKLSRELVSIDTSGETMELWVKVTALAGGSDTILYVYYDNPDGAETNDTSTWDDDFVMVYHMDGTTDITDSTSNGLTGTEASGPTEVAGQIGKARSLDGGDDYFTTTHDVKMDSEILTFECWIKATDAQAGADHHVLHKNLPARLCYDEDDATVKGGFTIREIGHTWYDSGADVISNGVWHYFCGRYDGSSVLDTWLDDAVGATNTIGDIVMDPNTTDFTIGAKDAGNGGFFKGLIDEVRYSTSHRSDNWMLTCYNNQNDPSTFYSVAVGT